MVLPGISDPRHFSDLPHFLLERSEVPGQLLLRSWPDPVAFHRWPHETRWVVHEPWLERWTAKPMDPDASLAEVIAGFWGTVPAQLSVVVRRLRTCQWPVLRMAAEHRAACDLAVANPALAVLFTRTGIDLSLNRATYQTRAIREALLPLRQHDALVELGFPGRRSMRRLLQRIPPESIRIRALLELRRVLQLGLLDARTLSHLPRIHAGILELVCDDEVRPFLHPVLLQQVARSDAELEVAETAQRLREIVLMMRRLDLAADNFRPRSIEEIRRRHADLSRDLELHLGAIELRRRARDLLRPAAAPTPSFEPRPGTLGFGSPPVPSTREIRWLGNEDGLRRWGMRQRNCVWSYRNAILGGSYAIYAIVDGKDEATLGLKRVERTGRWSLHQLVGPRNGPASSRIRRLALEWIQSHQVRLEKL